MFTFHPWPFDDWHNSLLWFNCFYVLPLLVNTPDRMFSSKNRGEKKNNSLPYTTLVPPLCQVKILCIFSIFLIFISLFSQNVNLISLALIHINHRSDVIKHSCLMYLCWLLELWIICWLSHVLQIQREMTGLWLKVHHLWWTPWHHLRRHISYVLMLLTILDVDVN